MSRSGKVVLVTGASSGIGAAIAKRLAESGYTVFGTSRASGAASPSATVRMLTMDVGNEQSISAAVDQISAGSGRLDVLVNNAGFGLAGAIEDTSADDMRRLLDTNVLGPLRMCQAVLPIMRRQRSGRIIQISSLAGRIGIPFQGAYCTSKFAIEGFTEALSMEVKPFGIDVVLIEPGDTKTNFTAAREWTSAAKASPVYADRAKHAIAVMEKSEQAGPPADKVARVVARAISDKNPKLRYVSATATERLALALKRTLSDRGFEKFIGSIYAPPRPKDHGDSHEPAAHQQR
jgi:NAD(P)-dependent dehydrogenase (short-subunit alcohol dehydrogenase family)